MNGGRSSWVPERAGDGARQLWPCLSGLLLCTAAAALPMPRNVTVEAVNNLYVLKWMWDQWETNYTVRFTVDYSFSDQEHYTTACNRTAEWQCDLTPQNLNYWASYTLRVRAEGPGQNSEWQRLLFRPHMQASLGPPSDVKVESSDSRLRVTFKEPLMAHNESVSSICLPSYRIQYWELDASLQRQELEVHLTEVSLRHLKALAVYCLQVRTICTKLEMASLFTPPKCERTQGSSHSLLWILLLLVFGFVLLLILLATKYCSKFKEIFPVYSLPTSILDLPMTITPLLQIPEENCTTLHIQEEVLCHQPEVESSGLSVSQWQDSSTKDLGISSWRSNLSSGQHTRDIS
uniref:Cytokine receptor family B5a n=1 Tax=Scleropages formosus TaxID=113540 RepID=A0A8F8SZM4_SCLFO|nr:cytokine receptor family B5a [Scleropages formosus]